MAGRGRSGLSFQPDEVPDPDFDPGHISFALRRSSTRAFTSSAMVLHEANSSISASASGALVPDSQFFAARGVRPAARASISAAQRNGLNSRPIAPSSLSRMPMLEITPFIEGNFRSEKARSFRMKFPHIPSCETRNWRNTCWRNPTHTTWKPGQFH